MTFQQDFGNYVRWFGETTTTGSPAAAADTAQINYEVIRPV